MAGSANGQPQQASQQPNVFDQSAGAYTAALGTSHNAANAASNIGANSQGAFQPVSALQVGNAPSARASNVSAGQLADTNLSPYMNPFQRDVIDTTMSGLQRDRTMAMNELGGQATAANAFGGSRHGVAMGEAYRGFDDNTARTLANLNTNNFQNAQQMGQFDIANSLQADLSNQQAGLQASMANQQAALTAGQADQNAALTAARANQQARLQDAQQMGQFGVHRANALQSLIGQQGQLSNLGFGMGMQANDAMMQAGGMQQGMQQQLIDQAAQQYGGWSGSPQQSLDTVNNTLGSIPIPQTQTQSSSPGLFDFLTAGAGFLSTPLTGGTAGTTIAGRLFG